MEGKLREFAARRDKSWSQAFLTAYPVLCQEAAKRLRSLYNPADYPPLEYVAQQFTLIWQYISFGVPDQLREISTKIWQDEREKAAEVMAEAGREIQQVLRTAMAELVKHMRDRLKDGPDGKPLRFKETTVSNLVDFLGTFDFRNVTDDAELKSLVDRARDDARRRERRCPPDDRRRAREGPARHGRSGGRAGHDDRQETGPEVPLQRGMTDPEKGEPRWRSMQDLSLRS